MKRLLNILFTCSLLTSGIATAQDKTNVPLSEGSRFPLILYSALDTDQCFAEVQSWGITHVHSYHMGDSVEADQPFMDRAARHDLKVMLNLKGQQRVGSEGDAVESLREYVNAFKDHPALGFWYFYDEPDGKHTVEQLRPFYEMLKEETPEIPVAVAHAWTKNWFTYGKVQDVWMVDVYPVTGAPFPKAKLGQATTLTRGARKYSDMVIPIVQAINWRVFAGRNQSEFRDYPVGELRFPNSAELRYFCFSSLATGVKGLSFFSYARAVQIDRSWPGEVLAPIVKEVSAFHEAMGYPKVKFIPQATPKELAAGLWQSESGEQWVVITNATATPQTGSWSFGSDLAGEKLTPWGATRESDATLKAGTISFHAEPWEAFVWKVEKR